MTWSDSQQILNYLARKIWVSELKNEFQFSVLNLAIFNKVLLCIFELNLNFGKHQFCRRKQELKLMFWRSEQILDFFVGFIAS